MILATNGETQTDRRFVDVGQTGHHVHGPYESRPAGIYRVSFDLALAGSHGDPERVCAVIDVTCNRGQVVLAEKAITVAELGQEPRIFSLLAEFADIRDNLEYRIYATGAAALSLGATPRLRRVSGVLDQEPRGALATCDPDWLAADTRRILRRLEPHSLCDHDFVRLGNPDDGGYVCVNDWEGIDTAFSFGINYDISWDSAVADRGLRIYQFDHTVPDPAPNDDRMVFEPKMIAAEAGPGSQDLAGLIHRHDKRAARPNIILKTDIEGGEWAMLDATSTADLQRIAWIVCELHYFQGLAQDRFRPVLDRGLAKLAETFALVHVHSNVWGGYSSLGNVIFPNVIEATFVNRAFYRTSENRGLFPNELDGSCDTRVPDFFLGSFRY